MQPPQAETPGPTPASKRPRRTPRDVAGLLVQVLLTALGVHMSLAVGFTLRWAGQPVVSYRHPAFGLVLILLGAGLRWVISPGFRRRSAQMVRSDAARVREYAAGAARIPWRASFCWVFLPALLVYQSNGRTIGSGDTAPAMQTALSIIVDGDVALDEFVDPEAPPYYVCRVGEHYYSRFSLGPAVVALPLVQLARWGGGELNDPTMRQRLEKVIASTLAAGAAMLMFLVLLRLVDLAPAVMLTIFFALASQNWSIASQALWQHGPVALCVAGVLFLECCGVQARARSSLLRGALLGFAVGCRPTAVILVGLFGLLVAVKRWRRLPLLLVGAVLAYAPFAVLHLQSYDALLGPYAHAAAEAKWAADLRVALPGNLVSPARGLLVYQPLCLLAALAFVPRFARRGGGGMVAVLTAWCVLHLVVVSRYTHWWGGHAWGPRFLTELMPALVVLMAPAVEWLWRRWSGRGLVLALTAWSIGLQALGVYSSGGQRWMTRPVDIDRAPQRLWDWSDPPFLYPWREVSVKLEGVFLDMYGTLTTGDRHAVESVCSMIISDTGVSVSPRELSVTWGRRFFDAMDVCSDENFLTLLEVEARTLRETMAALGVAVDPYPYARRLTDYWRRPPLQPEAKEFLATFPLPICVVSNADRRDLDMALESHGIKVAGVVTSEDVRSYKPAAKIFEFALRQMGWQRERVMHVGDSLHSDVGGARLAGLRSGWVNRAHRIHDVGSDSPDHEFEDLLDLTALVQRWQAARDSLGQR